MRYELDNTAEKKVHDELLNDPLPISATNLLAAIPDLSRQKSMRAALRIRMCRIPFLFERVVCAEILDHIGDPRGIDHLIYNSMAYHPLLKINQIGAKGWAHNGVRVADKLKEKHVALMVKDMLEHQVFHGPTLAYANVQTIVPAMLALLDAELPIKRFASYVLAYHGNDAGATILRDWAVASPYPQMPLEALSQLPGEEWIPFLESFINPAHPLYRHERYGGTSRYLILPSLRVRLALKKLTDLHEKAAFLYAEFGRTLNEVEVYTGTSKDDKAARSVNPPVTVLTRFNNAVPCPGVWTQDILADLADRPLQTYLAEKQLHAIKQLFETADLGFETLLDGRLKGFGQVTGVQRVRGIHRTGFLEDDMNWYKVPVKIYYDTDDYLQAATDWIINPLRHRFLQFGYEM